MRLVSTVVLKSHQIKGSHLQTPSGTVCVHIEKCPNSLIRCHCEVHEYHPSLIPPATQFGGRCTQRKPLSYKKNVGLELVCETLCVIPNVLGISIG